ncbi:MAG: hypothetical protein QGI32_06950 [Candidatus Latescibacteria bacterium]|jgi:hypothetical protein|nr:hypothetical protein [Gemmatimonadaceae bacterium]MDP6015816.1 hypothetical protein [Candidatus Latescibacterota bacterium]
MERFTVSRDDDIYEAFPDVALTPSGRLVCVFAECTHHRDRSYTRAMVTTSDDRSPPIDRLTSEFAQRTRPGGTGSAHAPGTLTVPTAAGGAGHAPRR